MTVAIDAAALLKANRRGILYMCAAMGLFVVNDSLVKYASQTMASAQLIFLRGIMATVLVLALVRASGTEPVIRVMGEADDASLVTTVVSQIEAAIRDIA